MSNDASTLVQDLNGLPFVRPIVRQIIEELFQSQAQWKSTDLTDRVIQIHRERGGISPTNSSSVIKRVLQCLRDEGIIIAPGQGWWRRVTSSISANDSPSHELTQIPPTNAVEDEEPIEVLIKAEKELGSGDECVYLYFNPNDRKLAELEGREVWECKIGRTGSNDAVNRILNQGIRTALSRTPLIGLVVRTDDSIALESILHASLRLAGAEVPDSPGTEWFLTSPRRIEAWYEAHQQAMSAITVITDP